MRASEKTALTAKIRSEAMSIGFDLVGFTPADPLEGAEFYARWVALGFAGEMSYLERNLDKRSAPERYLPGAKSVICVGLHYFHEDERLDEGEREPASAVPPKGRIAAYAGGDDYHDLVKAKLASLWQVIRETSPVAVEGRYCVDTAPVLERELAARAGHGWWGKNTCLISSKEGSYFFLGQIITDLELDYDEPAVDHCGSCTRCLDACPTDAFPEPYVLDARRCISYLTIELKGSIPVELRQGMGNWIFGCDICQDVCPWNREAATSREPAFEMRPGLRQASLPDLLTLDRDGFNRLFRGHAAKRTKRRGILRNVAVALGNSGDDAALPALIAALRDEEPLVRGHAGWALGNLGGSEARGALEKALVNERDESVIEEIEAALRTVQRSSKA